MPLPEPNQKLSMNAKCIRFRLGFDWRTGPESIRLEQMCRTELGSTLVREGDRQARTMTGLATFRLARTYRRLLDMTSLSASQRERGNLIYIVTIICNGDFE
jgi:hypothetical protein